MKDLDPSQCADLDPDPEDSDLDVKPTVTHKNLLHLSPNTPVTCNLTFWGAEREGVLCVSSSWETPSPTSCVGGKEEGFPSLAIQVSTVQHQPKHLVQMEPIVASQRHCQTPPIVVSPTMRHPHYQTRKTFLPKKKCVCAFAEMKEQIIVIESAGSTICDLQVVTLKRPADQNKTNSSELESGKTLGLLK